MLKECDLVIEAIAERLDWKKALYEKVAPYLGDRHHLREQHFGPVHPFACRSDAGACGNAVLRRAFFQPAALHDTGRIDSRPPRPSGDSWTGSETFLTTLGKGVIRAKDTPNFIANRVGVFSILAAFHHTRRFGLGFDESTR